MKQAVFKNFIFEVNRRLEILGANIKFTYKIETAFRANSWANVLSTCFYTFSMILFLDVLYGNVKTVAGYSRDEMFLFLFIGQMGFYISWIIHANLIELIEDVNKGNLDTLLVKPVPALFYITFKKVRIVSMLRDCVPPTIILVIATNWQNLDFSLIPLLAGTIIALLGIVTGHVVHFLSAIPVFWLGESESILGLSQEFEYNFGKIIPFEGFSTNVRLFLVTAIPVMISTGVATSVVLGKTPALTAFIGVVLVTAAALIVRQYVWKIAIRSYTSASS